MESVECASDHPFMEIKMAAVSLEIVEESPIGQQQDILSETKSEEFVRIDMPSNLIPTFKKVNLWGSTPKKVYEEGPSVGVSPTPNSEYLTGVLSTEEVAILALGNPQVPPSEKSPFFMPALPIHRAISMPAIPTRPFYLSSTDDSYIALNTNGVGVQPIRRSHSVPVSYSDEIMRDAHVKVLHVVPNRRMRERNTALLSASAIHDGEVDEDDITEEEAVCRICLGELGEEAFKLECDCKGDLALVHKQCIQRWFNLRGNRTCEICRKKVRNVTVKVKRMRSVNLNFLRETPVTYEEMIWNEALLLYVISWISYMLFIKVLQKFRRNGGHIDEPYGGFPTSIILAILTVAASFFGKWKHIWIYAVAQFVVFIVFALLFCILLYLNPVWMLILATIFALGISRGAGPAYLAFKKWREGNERNEVNNNNNHHDAEVPTEVDSTQETAESHYSDANSHESNEDTAESESHYSDANSHD